MAKDMSAKFAECMKPHYMMHSLLGLGLGLVIAGLFGALAGQTGIILGVIIGAAAVVGDYVVNK